MKYLVFEVQTSTDGTVATLVDSFDDLNTAESKFHYVLGAAAVSTLPKHAALLVGNDGRVFRTECYAHESEA